MVAPPTPDTPVLYCDGALGWIRAVYVGHCSRGHLIEIEDRKDLQVVHHMSELKLAPLRRWALVFEDLDMARDAVTELQAVGWDDVPEPQEIEIPPTA